MKPGDRLGKYILEERIGRGGMAEVWAGRVEGPGDFVKPVALKFILPAFSTDEEYGRLFFNEARIAAELQHANLVSIFDFDRVPADAAPELAGRYFIAMERIDGRNLAQVWSFTEEIRQPLPVEIAVHIVCEVLVALRYIHERQRLTRRAALIHRDVSPQNVLVSFAGEVKLSDFGIARLAASRATSGPIRGTRGKLGYVAPEVLAGALASHQTDQFAAGVLLWELLSGQRLFVGQHDAEVLEKTRTGTVPPPRRGDTELPVDLARVVLRMLAKEREARFPSTAAALDALQPFARSAGGPLRLSELMLSLFALPGAPASSGPIAVPGVARDAGPSSPPPDNAVRSSPGFAQGAADPLAVGPYGTRLLPGSEMPSAATPATRLLPTPIPRRPSTRRRDPSFSPEKEVELRHQAEEKHRAAIAAGRFSGSLEDWFRHHVESSGWDVFKDRKLPPNSAVVLGWPRLTNVGWRNPLLLGWNGTYPWGEDGYWIVEDPSTDEMMTIFPDRLGQDQFRDISREQWRAWWREHEVEPDTELPGGQVPMSDRARLLVPRGARPPANSEEWQRLLRIEQQREDRETMRRMRRIEVLSSPAPPPSPSIWRRLLRISFDRGEDPPSDDRK